jgi:hypothetical protein
MSTALRAEPDLLTGLLAGQVSDPMLRAAESAGADPAVAFCAAVCQPVRPLHLPGWHAVISRESSVLVLAQEPDLAAALAPFVAGGPMGLGLPRIGWSGARDTCRDALDAHRLALRRGGLVSFRSEWVAATLLAGRERLRAAWATGADVALRHEHLADAVRAFAAEGLSVVAASRVLHIHPNTVIYRLERWAQLTGWDARSYPGLVQSMACLEAVG